MIKCITIIWVMATGTMESYESQHTTCHSASDYAQTYNLYNQEGKVVIALNPAEEVKEYIYNGN